MHQLINTTAEQLLRTRLAGGIPVPIAAAIANLPGGVTMREYTATAWRIGVKVLLGNRWQLLAAAPAAVAAATTPTPTARTAPAATPSPAPAARVAVPTIDTAEIYASRRRAVERARAGSPASMAAQSVAGTPHRTASADDVYAARRQQVARARGAV